MTEEESQNALEHLFRTLEYFRGYCKIYLGVILTQFYSCMEK